MKKLMVLVVVLAVSLISGCATIVGGGGHQSVSFNSEPADATVTVSGKVLGKTPITVDISRDKNQSVVFEKEGYKTFTTQLSTTLNGWFWGNIVIGGLIGSTVDSVSGAIHEYSPDQYFVTLVPEKAYGMESNAPKSVKQILMAFGAEIRLELASGSGTHLDELCGVLGVKPEEKATAVAALKNLALGTTDDLALANKIIEVFSVK